MVKRFVDPFFPNRPVDDPNRFAGRAAQVEEAIDSLFQIANNNPKHTIITGDRGIGKSSLLFQTRLVAQGDNRLPERLGIDLGCEKHDFVCATHDAAPDQDVGTLASGLLRDLESVAGRFLKNLKLELNLGGILTVGQKTPEHVSIADIVHGFCNQVNSVLTQINREGKSGLLFFIDEIDRLSPDCGAATFFKLTTEKLARDGSLRVGFICAGITGAIQEMENEHASIFRVFRDILIPRLEPIEVEQILNDGFSKIGSTYDKSIVDNTVELCSGFPEPVHIMGSEMLSVDNDRHINEEDFRHAKEKVITEVRRNKLNSMLQQAGSGRYQDIVNIMAGYDKAYVPLSHISSELDLEQSKFSVNMGELIKKNIITRVDRGVYCFVDPLLKEYIRAFGPISYET